MHLKVSSAKWRPFCSGGDELTLSTRNVTRWRRRSWTVVLRAMAWCQTAPSYYLQQYWLIITGIFQEILKTQSSKNLKIIYSILHHEITWNYRTVVMIIFAADMLLHIRSNYKLRFNKEIKKVKMVYSIGVLIMMTSSNGNIFRVTAPLCGEFTGLRWIPLTKACDGELWCSLWSVPR